jgi:hypothetical protein
MKVLQPIANFCRCLSVIIVAAVFIKIGISGIVSSHGSSSLSSLWQRGFGEISTSALVHTDLTGLIPNIILANLPQLVLSFLYFNVNSLWTSMLAAKEWSDYRFERKPLRVTTPRGAQRSTYYLQLPYTYAIPLIVLSGTLHWLVSQSLFFARVNFIDLDGYVDEDYSISTAGYSIMAMIFSLIVGSMALLICVSFGLRKYKPGMPLAAGCSAVISAASHAPSDGRDAETKPLQWGVISIGSDGVGHCGFSSLEVSDPVSGHMYSGIANGK